MFKNRPTFGLAVATVVFVGLFGTAGYRELAHRLPNRARLSEFVQVRHAQALSVLQNTAEPVSVQGRAWVSAMDQCIRGIIKTEAFPAEGLGIPWASARQTPTDRQRVLDFLDERCAAEILDRVVLTSPDGAAALANLALAMNYNLPFEYEHMGLDYPRPLEGLISVQ